MTKEQEEIKALEKALLACADTGIQRAIKRRIAELEQNSADMTFAPTLPKRRRASATA
jgi:hypothetical protein